MRDARLFTRWLNCDACNGNMGTQQVDLSTIVPLWNTDLFAPSLKQVLGTVMPAQLSLGSVGPNGGLVEESPVTVTVMRAEERAGELVVKVGVFYNETLAGCSCGDDPMALGAFAQVEVRINKSTGMALFTPCDFD